MGSDRQALEGSVRRCVDALLPKHDCAQKAFLGWEQNLLVMIVGDGVMWCIALAFLFPSVEIL